MSRIEKEKKTMTKGGLMGMQVIDSEGNSVGTVKDVTFTVGKMAMTLIVATKEGGTSEIPWEDIQAAGEFVVLKAKSDEAKISVAQPVMQQPAQAQAQSQVCPICGGPLTFIPKYNRWYCYKDKKYV